MTALKTNQGYMKCLSEYTNVFIDVCFGTIEKVKTYLISTWYNYTISTITIN